MIFTSILILWLWEGQHIVDLSADEVDQWLVENAALLSTRTVADLKSILRRAITRAQSRDKVRRNVVLLCGTPTGQPGRPSKALTLEQAQSLVDHTMGSRQRPLRWQISMQTSAPLL